jgi:hypothetical protein
MGAIGFHGADDAPSPKSPSIGKKSQSYIGWAARLRRPQYRLRSPAALPQHLFPIRAHSAQFASSMLELRLFAHLGQPLLPVALVRKRVMARDKVF